VHAATGGYRHEGTLWARTDGVIMLVCGTGCGWTLCLGSTCALDDVGEAWARHRTELDALPC
jgi:hypothetical protein